ncbi:MAG: 23S rRNA pseudouridine synthase F, partial [Gammaproteobacteria bacterium]
KTKPAKVARTGRNQFCIVLTQGLNRQIRRMCSALGWRVKRLVRVRVMHIRLGSLPVGRWRELTPEEIEQLKKA